MENMKATLFELATVNNITETNQTESTGLWSLKLKSPMYADLKRMDVIIEKRTQNDVRTLPFKAYRKHPIMRRLAMTKLKD